MNCDTYCHGLDKEVDCSGFTGVEKEKCIKSCLDCRSPNKKYCYCPTIFPPKTSSRSLQGRIAHEKPPHQYHHRQEHSGRQDASQVLIADNQKFGKEGKSDDDNGDTVFWVLVIVSILVVAVCLGIFCYMRYNKRKKAAQSKLAKEQSGKSQSAGNRRSAAPE